MTTLDVAIIGCGMMGQAHAKAWLERGCAIRAVYDPDAQRAEAMAADHGATAAQSWQQAVEAEGVTAVSICTPACFHADIAIHAAGRGRHVLCEKPMALTMQQADAMITAAASAGVKLVIGHQYRGLGRFRKVKQLIDDGSLGSPLFLRFADMREVRPKLAMHRRDMSGGPVHDMAGHFFDLARWLTGREPREVTARGTVFGRGKPRLASIDDPGIDAAEILVGFDGGHTCSVAINWGLSEGTPAFSEEIICGPLAMMHLADDQVVVYDAGGRRTLDCPADPAGPLVRVDDLLDAIGTGEQPEVDGHAGRKALQTTLAALASIESGRPVHLADFPG